MGALLYLMGIALAGFAGFQNFQWYFIILSSLIMVFGYIIIRAPQIKETTSHYGIGAYIKIFSMQILLFSIITGPIYFVTSLLN